MASKAYAARGPQRAVAHEQRHKARLERQRLVLAAYVERYMLGDPHPHLAISKQLGMSPVTTRSYIWRARQEGTETHLDGHAPRRTYWERGESWIACVACRCEWPCSPVVSWSAARAVRSVGQQITDAINADPAEVERLRISMQQAREGLRRPWRGDGRTGGDPLSGASVVTTTPTHWQADDTVSTTFRDPPQRPVSMVDRSEGWTAGVRWAAAEADAQSSWREPVYMLDITDHLRMCASDPDRRSAVPRTEAPADYSDEGLELGPLGILNKALAEIREMAYEEGKADARREAAASSETPP